MTQYRLRLTGVPLAEAIQSIELEDHYSVADMKRLTKHKLRLNPMLPIQFIYKGKILSDTSRLNKIGIRPKDVMTLMVIIFGG